MPRRDARDRDTRPSGTASLVEKRVPADKMPAGGRGRPAGPSKTHIALGAKALARIVTQSGREREFGFTYAAQSCTLPENGSRFPINPTTPFHIVQELGFLRVASPTAPHSLPLCLCLLELHQDAPQFLLCCHKGDVCCCTPASTPAPRRWFRHAQTKISGGHMDRSRLARC